jgi:hypothetical protein
MAGITGGTKRLAFPMSANVRLVAVRPAKARRFLPTGSLWWIMPAAPKTRE